MTHPRRRGKEVEIEARRARVASLLLAGVSDQSKIAEQVGVDRTTISRDIKQIEQRWQLAAVQDIAAAKGKDLERIERLIAALWEDARKGKWLATDRVLALMQHRAKLLGLEAPAKQDISMDAGVRIEVVGVADEDMP